MAMMEEARHELHEALRDKIGHSPAATLMDALPPVGWADVATKHDLEHGRVLLTKDIDSVRSDLGEFEARVDLRFERTELKLEAKFQKEINNLFRNLVFAMIGSQTTFAAVLLAAIKL